VCGRDWLGSAANMPANATLLDIDPHEVARQLTLLMWAHFEKLSESDFLDLAWTKVKLHHKAVCLRDMRKLQKRIFWVVATLIIAPEELSQRQRAICACAQWAWHCFQHHDFFTACTIFYAIQCSAVYRMQKTRAGLRSGLKSQVLSNMQDHLDEIGACMDSNKNFKTYRERLETTPQPVLPFLDIFLTDLVYIDDNADTVEDGLINFRKRQLEVRVIKGIMHFQSVPFNFVKVDKVVELFEAVQERDPDTDLYKLSQEREPRLVE
jgi:son of sevenless-like protein